MNPVQSGILSVKFNDKEDLYKCYMPFIKNGGLFIMTRNPHKINSEVFALVTLPNEERKIPLAGKIVWLNTANNMGHPQGIGIQFADSPQNSELKIQIEALLATYKSKTAPFSM